MKIQSIFKKTVGVLLLMTAYPLVFGCQSNAKQNVAEYVVNTIPEPSHQVSLITQKNTHGKTEYHYIFASDLRDLEYDVYLTPDSNFGKYSMVNYYNLATEKYYEESLTEELSKCQNSEVSMTNSFNTVMHVSSEEDAKKIALTLEKCNQIISDQWVYTPGVDLTDSKIMGITFLFYPVGADKNDYSMRIGTYTLNGSDGADVIYLLICQMIS